MNVQTEPATIRKIQYPKFKREENKSCKLSDEQIKDIRISFGNGQSIINLAKLYSVSTATIRYWVNENYRLNSIILATNRRAVREKVYADDIKLKRKFLLQSWKKRKGDALKEYIKNNKAIYRLKQKYKKKALNQ